MGRINLLESGDNEEFERGGKKKPRNFRRVSTEEKYFDARRTEQDEDKPRELKARKPPQARSLHIGSQMPKGTNPESTSQKERNELENGLEEKKPDPLSGLVKKKSKKTYFPKNDIEHWTGDGGKMLEAVVEVLDRSRDAELIEIGEMIEKEFDDPKEQITIDSIVNDYPKYFFDKKEQAERKKVKIDENWFEAIRQFYIDEGKRWGLMKKIAPEKAELLGKYLELKLPVGIVEEDTGNDLKKNKEEIEVLLTIEQKNYINNVTIFFKKLSMGILEIVAEKEGRELGQSELKNYMGFSMKDLKQKYFINQPGYMDVFNESDLERIATMAVAKRQKNNK